MEENGVFEGVYNQSTSFEQKFNALLSQSNFGRRNIGQILSGVFLSLRIGVYLGDFRRSTASYKRIPDIVIMNDA